VSIEERLRSYRQALDASVVEAEGRRARGGSGAEPYLLPPVSRRVKGRTIVVAVAALAALVGAVMVLRPRQEVGRPVAAEGDCVSSPGPSGVVQSGVGWEFRVRDTGGRVSADLLLEEGHRFVLGDPDWGAPWRDPPEAFYWHIYNDGESNRWLLGPTPVAVRTVRIADSTDSPVAEVCTVSTDATPGVRWFAVRLALSAAKLYGFDEAGSVAAYTEYTSSPPATLPPTGVDWSQTLPVQLTNTQPATTPEGFIPDPSGGSDLVEAPPALAPDGGLPLEIARLRETCVEGDAKGLRSGDLTAVVDGVPGDLGFKVTYYGGEFREAGKAWNGGRCREMNDHLRTIYGPKLVP
jgi:hypothetical protein